MSDPTEADKAKARALYPLSYMGPHLRDAIAQALANEREAMRESAMRAIGDESTAWCADSDAGKALRHVAERIRRLP